MIAQRVIEPCADETAATASVMVDRSPQVPITATDAGQKEVAVRLRKGSPDANSSARARITEGGRVKALEARIDELERELVQTRRLHVRVAELTDIVQELLLPVAQQNTELLRERLEAYADSL